MGLMCQSRSFALQNQGLGVASATSKPVPRNQQSLMQVKLAVDMTRLKAVNSRLKRAELKRAMLEDYREYLALVMMTEQPQHNQVLVRVCLWAIDAGEVEYFLTLAEYALAQRMNAPDGFRRDLPNILLEELSEFILSHSEPYQYLNYLERLKKACPEWNSNDEISAKAYKAQGYTLESVDPKAALSVYLQAQHYGAKGLKGVVTRLQRGLLHDQT